MWAQIAPCLGYAYALSGRLSQGLPLVERAIDVMTSTTLMQVRVCAESFLAEAYFLAGRPADAMPIARDALKLSRTLKERGSEAWVLRLLADIHSHREPRDAVAAEDYYHQALALATELEMRPLIAHCHLGLGTLCRHLDRRELALEHVTAAVDMFRAMAMRFWLGPAEAALHALRQA